MTGQDNPIIAQILVLAAQHNAYSTSSSLHDLASFFGQMELFGNPTSF